MPDNLRSDKRKGTLERGGNYSLILADKNVD